METGQIREFYCDKVRDAAAGVVKWWKTNASGIFDSNK